MMILLSLAACSDSSQHHDHGDHMDHAEYMDEDTPMNDADHTDHMGDMDHQDHMDTSATTASMAGDLPQAQAQEILTMYLEVKDALVQTDGVAAQTAVGELLGALGADGNELVAEIRQPALEIVETEDTEVQREHFFTLSQAVYAMLQATKAHEKPIYRQYCPMAFSNTGAFWLAAEKEVNNPYFGDMMLHCGKVEEEL